MKLSFPLRRETPRAGGAADPVRSAARRRQRARAVAASIVAFALAGCASFSPDGGFDAVRQLSNERIGQQPSYQRSADDADAARRRVAALLAQPLTADTAVEVALLENKALQADYAELGIAEADLVRAGRLANPTLSFGRLSGGGIVEIDRAIVFNVLSLFTLPLAQQFGQQRFEQAQLLAAYQTVGVAAEARRAYFDAVAAQQLVGYFGQVMEAAQASADLARRMAAAGNFSRLDELREQAFRADATTNLARAQHRAVAAREQLVRALGLAADAPALRLPERLPALPGAPAEAQDAQQAAIDKRLDVLIAKRHAQATAQALGLTQATRLVNVLHVGYQNKSLSGEPLSNGYEIELELPLFDFGAARVARAEATYMQAVNRVAAVAARAQSEVRESYSAYRAAYDVARHFRDEVVPLRKRISDETLLRYNGMLIGVFELLADARGQVASVAGAVEALRDFWLAQTDLQSAIAGRSPAGAARASVATAAAAEPSADH